MLVQSTINNEEVSEWEMDKHMMLVQSTTNSEEVSEWVMD